MAKKKEIEKKKHAGSGHVCRECARGEWNTENRNWNNKVFFGYCEHATFARTKDGRGVFLCDTQACECFKAGERPSWRTKGGMV